MATSPHPRALVVSPRADALPTLVKQLHALDYTVTPTATEDSAATILRREDIACVFTTGTPGASLAQLLADENLPWIALGAADDVAAVVRAMKAGALDFLSLPLDAAAVARAMQAVDAHTSRDEPPTQSPGARFVGSSDSMAQVEELIERAARTDATVLVRGETGTGKELVARALHELSARRDGPFVKLNCSAFPDSLLESELFGFEKGAFTGASARKLGRIELAHGGTLFLDEIGDISQSTQVKLLRVLQEREIERLGGQGAIKIDVRIVSATHRDLEGMTHSGTFREDLFYRLNVIPIWLPPLRARRDDIAALSAHFAAAFSAAHGKPAVHFDADALRLLRRERWPGNVRQLQNLVERLVVLADAALVTAADVERVLQPQVVFATETPSTWHPKKAQQAQPETMDEARRSGERQALQDALQRAGGNRTLAARLLGVSRRTLYNKLAELGVDDTSA